MDNDDLSLMMIINFRLIKVGSQKKKKKKEKKERKKIRLTDYYFDRDNSRAHLNLALNRNKLKPYLTKKNPHGD